MKNWIYRHSTGFLITQASFQTSLFCWVCQILHEASFQNIIMYSIGGQNGFQGYCDTSYSRGGVNQMWILKNSKDLLEYIQSRPLSSYNSIKTFDFSTLYTTIPHSKLKDSLRELVQLCFIKKNVQIRYKHLMLGRNRSYYVLLFLPTCSFISMRQTSYRGFSRKRKEASPIL